jgi:hypothetical protein
VSGDYGKQGYERPAHQVVRLDDLVDIVSVYTDGYSHEEMLRAFSDFAIYAEEVGSLKGLVAKVVLVKAGASEKDPG